MASRTNATNAVINSAAATVTVIANPSTTKFMYIWEIALVVGGATNLTFNNGGNALTGAMPMLANGSIFRSNPDFPAFVIDPGQSFTITNSGSAQVSGWAIYSN